MRFRALGKTGLQVSMIGFGASPLGDEFGAISAADAESAVATAINGGINFFDVSPYYGRTLAEKRLGATLAGKRERIFLATKCGRYDASAFDFSAGRVKSSIDESLSRLRTDYVDLLTAHDIEFADREQIVHETIPAMRELQRAGKVKHVGISGFPLKLLADVAVRARVDTVLSYCRFNLLNRELDRLLIQAVAPLGIGVINASPLHMRILTTEGPPAWHPAPEPVKRTGREIVRLCQAHGVDPAMLALRFCLDHSYISTTLVGMANAAQVEQNLKSLDLALDRSLLSEIDGIVEPVRKMTWRSGRTENNDA